MMYSTAVGMNFLEFAEWNTYIDLYKAFLPRTGGGGANILPFLVLSGCLYLGNVPGPVRDNRVILR